MLRGGSVGGENFTTVAGEDQGSRRKSTQKASVINIYCLRQIGSLCVYVRTGYGDTHTLSVGRRSHSLSVVSDSPPLARASSVNGPGFSLERRPDSLLLVPSTRLLSSVSSLAPRLSISGGYRSGLDPGPNNAEHDRGHYPEWAQEVGNSLTRRCVFYPAPPLLIRTKPAQTSTVPWSTRAKRRWRHTCRSTSAGSWRNSSRPWDSRAMLTSASCQRRASRR